MSKTKAFTQICLASMSWLVGLSVSPANTPSNTGAERYALVVGNSAYSSVAPLKNPVNDARAVATALERLGVEVLVLIDASREEMEAAVSQLDELATGAEATLFYYAGHGFQLNGVNYLVPVDASLKSRDEIETETVRLDEVILRLQEVDRQTLVLLDACRENPLPEAVSGIEGAGGLAQVQVGYGTYIAFATQPGNVALDGMGTNSPFTGALINNIETPGISVSDLMIRVRNDVESATERRQQPWETSSLRSQFYFKPENERVASLSEQDLTLLTNLSPELRAQFEDIWDITITVPDSAVPNEEITSAAELQISPDRTQQLVPQGTAGPVESLANAVETLPKEATAVDLMVTAAVPDIVGKAETVEPSAGKPLPIDQYASLLGTDVVLPPVPRPASERPAELTSMAAKPLGIPVPPALSVQDKPADLARAVQVELSRLGCYRSTIDGLWGRQSSRALLRYFATRQIAPLGKEPSPELYSLLASEPLVVCVQTQPRTPGVQTAVVVEAVVTPQTQPQRPTFNNVKRQPRTSGAATTPTTPDQHSPIKITPGISMF